MNLVEADSREFSLNRYRRRLESYRLHHEQSLRKYQPLMREETRKQVEETSQLHKRWVEFQNKRIVGKAKNDPLSGNGPSFVKKTKKKLPLSPENQNISAQPGLQNAYIQPATISNAFNKTSPNLPCKQTNRCQGFNAQNAFQGFPHSAPQNKKSYNSSLEGNLFQSPVANKSSAFENMESKFLEGKQTSSGGNNPAVRGNVMEMKSSEENPDRADDSMSDREMLENQMEQIFMGEDWDQFWDSINRDGDMPKEVLEVLQENENCEDISNTPASFPPGFLQSTCLDEGTEARSEGHATAEPQVTTQMSMLGTSFMPCAAISSTFAHAQPTVQESIQHPANLSDPMPPMFAVPGSNFADQGVIRNNPHFANQNHFVAAASFNCDEGGGFNRPPSYDDAVNRKFSQPTCTSDSFDAGLVYGQGSQFYREEPTQSDMFRQSFTPHQQFYVQGSSRNATFRKMDNFCDNSFISYLQQNPRPEDSSCYQPTNVQRCSFDSGNNLYQTDFHGYSNNSNNTNIRFGGSDFNNQAYQKMNASSYDYFGTQYSYNTHHQQQQQQLLPTMMQHHLDPNLIDTQSVNFHNTERNNYYWSCQGNSSSSININNNIGSMNMAYQKHNAPNAGGPSCSYPAQMPVQQFPGAASKTSSGSYGMNAKNKTGDRGCIGTVDHLHDVGHHPSGISVDTELSIIEDIINKK